MPDDTDSKKQTPGKTPRKLPTTADPNRNAQIVKEQSTDQDGKTTEYINILTPYGYALNTRGMITEFKGLVSVDNNEQFLTACWINGETEEDKEARETLLYYIAEILNRLAEQAINQKPIDYKYTSEIIAEAIRRTREDGINAPHLDKLEAMQKPQEETPDLPGIETSASITQKGEMQVITIKEAKEIAEKLRYPAPPYVLPEYIKIPTANMARNFYNADTTKPAPGLNGTQFVYPVDQRPHQHFVFMRLLDAISEQYPIEPIDKNILISLGNLYGERKAAGRVGIHGGAILSTEDIIRLYRGFDASADITEEEINAVKERILKMLNMRVSFDFTQHFVYNKVGDEVQLSIPDEKRVHVTDANGETRIIRFSYTGNMIDARIAEIEYSNGKIVTAYELLTPPILYEYSEKIKQVQRIETKLLDLRKKANSNKDADIIKIYLLEQINAMKHGRSNRILLKTLFSELRIEITSRQLKKNKVKLISRILQHFKETKQNNGKTLITGFSEVTGYHRALEGYDIYFENEPNK